MNHMMNGKTIVRIREHYFVFNRIIFSRVFNASQLATGCGKWIIKT